jgi:K+-transporting ATPase c subunit
MGKPLILIIIFFLIFGIIYRLILTSGGNFIFNMDNARDMIDVREMVVLGHLRLIGPTSGLECFYNGPGWYYFLSLPFVLSGGHPYGAVLLMIVFWANKRYQK